MPNQYPDMADAPENPLLDFQGLPRFSSIRPEHVEPALDYLLARNRERIAELEALEESLGWANFVAELEALDERLGRMWSPVSHLNAVKDSPELRRAYENALPRLTDYHTDLSQSESLFNKFRALRDGNGYGKLDRGQRRIVDNALRDYRLAGVDLPAGDKARFKAIQQELATLSNRFERNVLDATESWTLQVTDETPPGRHAGIGPGPGAAGGPGEGSGGVAVHPAHSVLSAADDVLRGPRASPGNVRGLRHPGQ
jgi:oligopeptidase A